MARGAEGSEEGQKGGQEWYRKRLLKWLTALKTPDFFIRDNRTATESIHDILRDYLARATDTMTVEVDAELLMVKMYELLYC